MQATMEYGTSLTHEHSERTRGDSHSTVKKLTHSMYQNPYREKDSCSETQQKMFDFCTLYTEGFLRRS